MNEAPIIIIMFVLPGVAHRDSSPPQITVVRTWDDLVQAEPQALTKEVCVRIGVSSKSCHVYGGVVLYCLADGLTATQCQWRHQIGPLPLGTQRDPFSETFWGILDPVSVALVGGHKCGKASALFMYPLVVTEPSDAISHPKFQFVEKALGLKFNPATKAELTIRVFKPDKSLTRLPAAPEALGWCRVEATGKAEQPWLRLNVPGDQRAMFRVASPAWDPLLPIPLPKNLAQRLPSLFPEEPTGELVLTYAAGKLILKSKFSLAENPEDRLLVKYWRGGKPDLSKTELLRAERLLRSSEHEYTVHVTPAQGVTAGDTIGVQLLYSELGWHRVDPISSPNAISDHPNPLLPVVSNRVDFTVEARGKQAAASASAASAGLSNNVGKCQCHALVSGVWKRSMADGYCATYGETLTRK